MRGETGATQHDFCYCRQRAAKQDMDVNVFITIIATAEESSH